MANNMNANNTDDVLKFFKTSEYQDRMKKIDADEAQRAYFRTIADDVDRNGGIYHPEGEKQTFTTGKCQKMTNKSIGPTKRVKESTKKVVDIHVKMPNLNKIALILCTAVIVVSLGTGTYALFGEKIADNMQAREEMNTSIDVLKTKAIFNLFYNDLAGMNVETQEIIIKDNSVEDYRRLGISNPLDVYTYSLVLPRSEFSKFIQSVSYNEYGFDHYYVSEEQFLRINGMFDKKGNPSDIVFGNYMETKIKELSPEILEEYKKSDGILTFGDMLKEIEARENKNVGGK